MVMRMVPENDGPCPECGAEYGEPCKPHPTPSAYRWAGLVIWLLAAAVVLGLAWRVFAVVGGLR